MLPPTNALHYGHEDHLWIHINNVKQNYLVEKATWLTEKESSFFSIFMNSVTLVKLLNFYKTQFAEKKGIEKTG